MNRPPLLCSIAVLWKNLLSSHPSLDSSDASAAFARYFFCYFFEPKRALFGSFGHPRQRRRTQPKSAKSFTNSLFCCSSGSSRGGTRTPDPVINSHLLYQLSYSGLRGKN